MKPTIAQYKLNGSGPRGSVCLLFVKECGIGDDISALPVVSSLAEENDVTVYTIHPELWRGIDVTVVGVGADYMTCDNGEFLDVLWDAEHLPKFEAIYKLSTWGAWEDCAIGGSTRPRMQQLAEILEIDSFNEEFDFEAALKCNKFITNEAYVVLSVESREPMRSFTAERAFEVYSGLRHYSNVVWLTEGVPSKEQRQCSSHRHLIDLVYNAERVVGIDNGVMHIACALGKPVTIVAGMTNARAIFEQYNSPLRVIQSKGADCISPCYRLPDNGFVGGRCCGVYTSAKCMDSVEADEIISLAFMNSEVSQGALAEPVLR